MVGYYKTSGLISGKNNQVEMIKEARVLWKLCKLYFGDFYSSNFPIGTHIYRSETKCKIVALSK